MAILRSETNLVCVFVAGEMVDDKLSGQSRGGKGKLCHSLEGRADTRGSTSGREGKEELGMRVVCPTVKCNDMLKTLKCSENANNINKLGLSNAKLGLCSIQTAVLN